MKERDFDVLARELEDLLNYSECKQAMVEVVAIKDALEIKMLGDDKQTFHHPEALTDFCRCKRMLAYATIKDGNLVYRVF